MGLDEDAAEDVEEEGEAETVKVALDVVALEAVLCGFIDETQIPRSLVIT